MVEGVEADDYQSSRALISFGELIKSMSAYPPKRTNSTRGTASASDPKQTCGG
jgi:hypothetical protein